MEKMAHKIMNELKFTYPCIAYVVSQDSNSNELVIQTETKLSKLYPLVYKVDNQVFLGEDFWGRPTFKDIHEQFYCEIDGSLYFKGNSFEGEPHYPVNIPLTMEYQNIDSEISSFDAYQEKINELFLKNAEIQLIEFKKNLKVNDYDIRQNKLICTYNIKIKKH